MWYVSKGKRTLGKHTRLRQEKKTQKSWVSLCIKREENNYAETGPVANSYSIEDKRANSIFQKPNRHPKELHKILH